MILIISYFSNSNILWYLIHKDCSIIVSDFYTLKRKLWHHVVNILHACSVTKSYPTLRNPMNCRPPGFSVHGITHTKILTWVSVSFSRGSCWPREQTHVSCIGRWIFYQVTTWTTREFLINVLLTCIKEIIYFVNISNLCCNKYTV